MLCVYVPRCAQSAGSQNSGREPVTLEVDCSMISSMLAPASRFSNTADTGMRVSRNTHAPPSRPGTLSTTGHRDQSRVTPSFHYGDDRPGLCDWCAGAAPISPSGLLRYRMLGDSRLARFYDRANIATRAPHRVAQGRTQHLVDCALLIEYWRNGHVELHPQLFAAAARRAFFVSIDVHDLACALSGPVKGARYPAWQSVLQPKVASSGRPSGPRQPK